MYVEQNVHIGYSLLEAAAWKDSDANLLIE